MEVTKLGGSWPHSYCVHVERFDTYEISLHLAEVDNSYSRYILERMSSNSVLDWSREMKRVSFILDRLKIVCSHFLKGNKNEFVKQFVVII